MADVPRHAARHRHLPYSYIVNSEYTTGINMYYGSTVMSIRYQEHTVHIPAADAAYMGGSFFISGDVVV